MDQRGDMETVGDVSLSACTAVKGRREPHWSVKGAPGPKEDDKEFEVL